MAVSRSNSRFLFLGLYILGNVLVLCSIHLFKMPPTKRFEPSSIKNKIKREEITRKLKKDKRQDKLKRRLALAKTEKEDPAAKKVRRLVHRVLKKKPPKLMTRFSDDWHKMFHGR